MDFEASFSYSFKRFSPLVLEPNTSIQKESLSRVFKSDFLCFLPQIQSLLFSHILELSLTYLSYRRVIVRVILGDQSVVITKVLILVLRRQTCGFAVFEF